MKPQKTQLPINILEGRASTDHFPDTGKMIERKTISRGIEA